MKDLKSIYKANNKEEAQTALNQFDINWGNKYPGIVKSWLDNWDRLSNYFKYPQDIRRIIYTTNVIESFNAQIRKFTKTKRVFSNDMSLLKLIYLAFSNISKGWIGTMSGWTLTHAQLFIIFEDRMRQP